MTACYDCGCLRFRWRLNPVQGKPHRICDRCLELRITHQLAFAAGVSAGSNAAYDRGVADGVAEQKAKQWVENGRPNT